MGQKIRRGPEPLAWGSMRPRRRMTPRSHSLMTLTDCQIQTARIAIPIHQPLKNSSIAAPPRGPRARTDRCQCATVAGGAAGITCRGRGGRRAPPGPGARGEGWVGGGRGGGGGGGIGGGGRAATGAAGARGAGGDGLRGDGAPESAL